MNNLFENGKNIDTEIRRPDRPLGELSDFVVTRMPGMLQDIRMGTSNVATLIDSAEEMVKEIKESRRVGLIDPDDLDLAGLDVKMVEAVIVSSGGSSGPQLTEMVNNFSHATDMLPGLTYEDLIFINPLETDPRTFTGGLVGRSERDFYLGHRILEGSLDTTIQHCIGAIRVLMQDGESGVAEATIFLKNAVQTFSPVISYTGRIGMRMPRDHFEVFRKYLNGNPERGIMGPSGKYTSGIPTLDFLLGGEVIEQSYPKLTEELAYYPRGGRRAIECARGIAHRGESLAVLARRLDDTVVLLRHVGKICEAIRKFRLVHLIYVHHLIPQALDGTTGGTGGESNVKAFLSQREAIDHIGKGDKI